MAVRLPLTRVRPPLSPEETQNIIGELITGNEPFFVGRFGSTELRALVRYKWLRRLGLTSSSSQPSASIFSVLARLFFRKLSYDSGFFPLTFANLSRFSRLMERSIPAVDLLGSWVPGESVFSQQLENARITQLENLEPFWAGIPWTTHLEGLKVLVIHPFAKTISDQYETHRASLFDNPNILPLFDLLTLEAVQSLGGAHNRFANWFDAFDWMLNESLKIEFDVALIGCGAYGFPLAAELKRNGKKAIHLGGMTQILFGIRGRRWDSDPRYASLINESWTRPSSAEVPDNSSQLGQNSYW